MDLWGSMDIGYDLDETRDTLDGGKLRDSRTTLVLLVVIQKIHGT
jgi:hypothetical protein